MCVQEKPTGNTMLVRVLEFQSFESYNEMLAPEGVDRVQQLFLPGFTGMVAEAAEMYRTKYTADKYNKNGVVM